MLLPTQLRRTRRIRLAPPKPNKAAPIDVHMIFHDQSGTYIFVRKMGGGCASPWNHNAPNLSMLGLFEGDAQDADLWKFLRRATQGGGAEGWLLKKAQDRIRRLERILGQKTEEVETLKEAVKIGREKKLISRSPLPGVEDFERRRCVASSACPDQTSMRGYSGPNHLAASSSAATMHGCYH